MISLSDPLKARAYVENVAAHRGWQLNPDGPLVATIVAGLATQARKLGKPYCPCRDVDGGPDDRDVICPCAYANADIEEHRQCFCGLFLAPGHPSSAVGSIPERRP